ncbi:MAG: hypothetical protein VKO64_01195 [Candidatus Sericytochromatia bacterium]|nr:hypothetical protein [Candidatus Sericytochromatia bacterium]
MPAVSRLAPTVIAAGLPCLVLWACTTQTQGASGSLATGGNPVLPLPVGGVAGTPRPAVSVSPTTPPPLFAPPSPTPIPTPTPTLVPIGIAVVPALPRSEAYAFNQFFVPDRDGEAEKPDLPYRRTWVSVVQYGRPVGGALPTVAETTQPVLSTWTLTGVQRLSVLTGGTPTPGPFILLEPQLPGTASEAAEATASQVQVRIVPQPSPFLGTVTGQLKVVPVSAVPFAAGVPAARRVAEVPVEAANVGTTNFEISRAGGRGR